jgi:endo-1,3-beta-xylanase
MFILLLMLAAMHVQPIFSLKPPCLPTKGKTAVVIGQDYYSIRNYTHTVNENSNPFGLMSYTSVSRIGGETDGLKNPVNYGSGIEWASGLVEKYPSSAVQLGLWIVDDCENIRKGKYDESLDNLIAYMSDSETNYYLRIGYEFDTSANRYPVKDYKRAFQYIVSYIRNAMIDTPQESSNNNNVSNEDNAGAGLNVAFVWHASGMKPRDGLKYEDWFPGNEFVDWCGISLFQQPYECSTPLGCVMKYPDGFAQLCQQYNLPLMIAESAPYGGIVSDKTAASSPNAANSAGFKGSTWSQWFVPVLSYIQRNDVRMWSYINCDWDAQPMWQANHAPGMLWGDSRLEGKNTLL